MKNSIYLSLLLILLGNSQNAPITLQGQDAKNLYNALIGIGANNSTEGALVKTATQINCREYYFGPRYNLHTECDLTDALFPESAPIHLHDIQFHNHNHEGDVYQGAVSLMSALKGATITSDSGNPPAQYINASASCSLTNPTDPLEPQDADKFSCTLKNL